MIKGKDLALELLHKIIGLKPTRAKLGHGSFITIDFGRDIPTQVKTKAGTKTKYFGEWYLWIYMCGWRIDKNKLPVAHSNDPREKIEQYLSELAARELTEVLILNDAFDAKLQFGNDLDLYLFSCSTEEQQQWMFYTPDEKVFIAGPSATWSYKSSS